MRDAGGLFRHGELHCGRIASVIAAAATGDFGVAVFGFVLTAIAFCRWWLYGRLVCLGGNSCAIGLATSVSPPQLKTGLNREDTDYGVDLLLARSTLCTRMSASRRSRCPGFPAC